jgi:ABC-type multidrug transport system ATPase subunit
VSLKLSNIGKKFKNNWVFKNIYLDFNLPGAYAIMGANGSGKSTLLQIISGQLSPTEGRTSLRIKNKEINTENWPKQQVYAAPYFELIEEMFLDEFIDFYIKFKPLQKCFTKDDVIKISYLEDSKKKQIKNFSSGMKQRLKLALAWLTKASVVLLDEPCSNLDEEGIEWYKNMALKYSKDKLVIVCSNNIKAEFFFCKYLLKMENISSNKNLKKIIT